MITLLNEGKVSKTPRSRIKLNLGKSNVTDAIDWEIFDESSTEDRHQMIKELLEHGYVAKYEDLKDILDRSTSSAERYIKQAIETGCFSEKDWKEGKYFAKTGSYSRENRIEKGKQLIEDKFRVLRNENGRGGRYVVERKMFEEMEDF